MPPATGIDRREAQKDEVLAAYLEFDTRFQDRPDYRLWRTGLFPYFAFRRRELLVGATSLSEGWGSWPENARACADAEAPLIFWSAIGLAPEIIRRHLEDATSNPDSPVWDFAERLLHRLRDRPAPLAGCPASCGAAAVLFLNRYQNLLYRAGSDLSVSACEDLFAQVRGWFGVVDPSWMPGRRLDMDEVRDEQAGADRLRAVHSASEFALLAKTLGILGPTIALSIHELTPRTEALLGDAYRYGLTAWLTARSRRIDEMLFQAGRGRLESPRSQERLRDAFLDEFAAHLKLGNAARNAGEYLESGKHLYLMYRLIPDQFIDLPEVQKELTGRNGLIRYLQEVGLEVDARFQQDMDQPHIQKFLQRQAAERTRLWHEPRQETGEIPPPTGDVGFSLRVHRDLEIDPLWKILREEIPPSPRDRTAFGYLLTIVRGLADAEFEASSDALAAAYQLALRYGFVRSASKLLARGIRKQEFELTPTLLQDFVHSVKRCTQLDPFGMRQEVVSEWQSLIREGCACLYERLGSAWMSGRDRLWIHETLINRTHVQHKSLSTSNARRLFEKSVGTYSIDGLREFYDLYYNFSRRAPGIANVETIADRIEELGDSALGAPVAISLMRMGPAVSIVAIGRGGKVAIMDCLEPGLDTAVAEIVSEADHWFKTQGLEPSRQIGWRSSLRRIAAAILAVADRCDPAARVLLISMETSLAQLPWQHLITSAGATDRLVSIIPSLSAFTLPDRAPTMVSYPSVILSNEPGPEIAEIVDVIESTTAGIDLTAAGVCIVAGHGSVPEERELPAVRIGPDRVINSFDQWLEILGSRITLFHCCHSGTPKPLFMEEFGGVAGLAVCLGTNTFIAPVSEVFASTAATLQRNLFASAGDEIGVSYLAAIRQDPACCLYNLYGNPYEHILPKGSFPAAGAAQFELEHEGLNPISGG